MVNLTSFLAILSLCVSAVVIIAVTLQYISIRQQVQGQIATLAQLSQHIKAAEDLEFPRYEDLRTEISKCKSSGTHLSGEIEALEDRVRILQGRVAAIARHTRGRTDREEQPADEIDKLLGDVSPGAETARPGRKFGEPIKGG